MSKLIFTMILFLVLHIPTFSQTEKYTMPTVWENYSVKDKNITVQMPKLPVLINSSNSCRGEESSMFSAYSDGVVYVLVVTSKVKISEFCSEKKNFDKENFNERVESLKNQSKTEKVTENANGIKLIDEDKIYKLTNDYENKRWFELQIFGANESKAEVKNFLASLKIEGKPNGKEIGKGALRNYGDENAAEAEIRKPEENSSQSKGENNKSNIIKMKLIIKPQASYTDAARQSQTQGTVRLKVKFLANGGIGNITTVSELPNGLTEQAIIAASKIFFIPASKNGNFINSVAIVEYGFYIF